MTSSRYSPRRLRLDSQKPFHEVAAKFAIVIPVMRKPMLKQVLEYYCALADTLIARIVIVDFDQRFSEEHGLYEPLAYIPHTRIAVTTEPYFNKSRALNLGVFFSDADLVVVCDADVLIKRETLAGWSSMFANANGRRLSLVPVCMIETDNGVARDAPGIVAFTRSDFLSVAGYCSVFTSWGFEDRDFLWRLEAGGIRVIESGCADHISHDEVERTRNYPLVGGIKAPDALQDRLRMREQNLSLFESRKHRSFTQGTLFEDLARYTVERNLPGVSGFCLKSQNPDLDGLSTQAP